MTLIDVYIKDLEEKKKKLKKQINFINEELDFLKQSKKVTCG